jgi:hypothetical protein
MSILNNVSAEKSAFKKRSDSGQGQRSIVS